MNSYTFAGKVTLLLQAPISIATRDGPWTPGPLDTYGKVSLSPQDGCRYERAILFLPIYF